MESWSEQQKSDFFNLEELIDLRQQNYYACQEILSKEIATLSKRGNVLKVFLIVLGAFVATKGITDQLMLDLYEEDSTEHHIVLICYTIIGVMITIMASLEAAFKYSEKAAGLRILSSQVQSYIRKNMSDHTFAYNNEQYDEAMNQLMRIIKEQNDELNEIEDKSVSFGVNLASKVDIDFSIPRYFGGE